MRLFSGFEMLVEKTLGSSWVKDKQTKTKAQTNKGPPTNKQQQQPQTNVKNPEALELRLF